MAKISDNIQKVHDAMDVKENQEGLGALLRNHAIDAIMSGPDTDPWRKYMSMFAENEAQLDRLSVPKATDGKWLRAARAYMVANSVCAVHTNTKTGNGVFKTPSQTVLDENVSEASDNNMKTKWRPKEFADYVK